MPNAVECFRRTHVPSEADLVVTPDVMFKWVRIIPDTTIKAVVGLLQRVHKSHMRVHHRTDECARVTINGNQYEFASIEISDPFAD